MANKIKLSVNGRTIKATADDEHGNSSSNGHLVTKRGKNILWIDQAGGGSAGPTFQVSFLEQTTGATWPFTSPPQPTLTIPAGGHIQQRLNNDKTRDWKYSITRTDCDDRDPMIIIRGGRISIVTAVVASAVSFVAGALVALYLLRW